MAFFETKKTLLIKGKILSLETPIVMGVLNITPDSFYDGGKWVGDIDKSIEKAGRMLEDGATIIDVGGYSSRPGATDVSLSEELSRVLPVIEALVKAYPEAIISIDTFRAEVATKAVAFGATIVNDISGGNLDKEMFATVAKLQVPYILMHMRGTPKSMQSLLTYDDLLLEMLQYFNEKVESLKKIGCKDIIIDPGFGFAKSLAQNYWLLSHLAQFKILNLPILIGVSRKSMIYKKLGITANEALNGTTVLNTLALRNGASILRVHDVLEAHQITRLLYDTK
ncbi:MAG: dihydropteroate synthase [Bacteroidota bacterium]